MQFHQDFSHGSDLSEKSSLKRPFTKKWSSKDPESYPWWRKVSAIKTEQSSAVKIKKTPFSTLKNGGKSVQNQVNFDGFRPKCTLLSDERMHEKTPFSSMEVGNKCSKPKNPGLKKGDEHERARVLETLKMFRAKCKEISQKSGVDVRRIDFTAKYELTKQGKLCCTSCKSMGNVPGVIVGDRFKYRVELTIVGLHSRSQHGIDYMMYHGQILATCVVAKEGYSDKMTDSEVITYTGEGGIVKTNQGDIYEDQKLIRGNRALVNSMKVKNDVRVVRGFGRTTYIYDGLYKVVGYEEKRGFFNNLIFEFKLKRCPGQPSICWYKLKNA